LVSREYFSEVKTHLNPGGILTANTTGSYDILATGDAVFAHAYRYANFLYASDRPLSPVLPRLQTVLRPDGAQFSLEVPYSKGGVVDRLSGAKLDPAGSFIARGPVSGEIITDDNMLTEYRHGMQFLPDIVDARVRRPFTEFGLNAP
jgi:hypothetical protein